MALFFCDPCGGTVIAVLWKPKAFIPAPFKVRAEKIQKLVCTCIFIHCPHINLSTHHFLLTFFFSYHLHQTSQVSARNVEVTGEVANTVPNVEAILEDFQILGKDLVKSVEAKSEKWSL